jgi:WD40 repeat protein
MDDSSPLNFRHLGFVRQTRAACLKFCYEASTMDGVLLSTLPPEIVEVICRLIVAGTSVVRFTCPEQLECVAELQHGDKFVHALALIACPDGQLLASGSGDTVKLWDLVSRQCVATLEGHANSVLCLAAVADRDGVPLLASGSNDKTVILWNAASHRKLATLRGHESAVHALCAFKSSTGHPYLSSGGRDYTVMLWDAQARGALATLIGHDGFIMSLCAFKDASGADFLASGATDRTIRIWDPSTQQSVSVLRGHGDDEAVAVVCLATFTSETGVPMLASASDDHILKIWDLTTCVALATLECSAKSLLICAAVDGRALLGCATGTIRGGGGRLVDMSTGRAVFGDAITIPTRALLAYADREAGSVLAAAGKNRRKGVIQLWIQTD